MLGSAIGRLRLLGMLEGASFLLLLGVAMPLKYLAGIPLAVKVVGWIHGMLFVAFALAIPPGVSALRWSGGRGLLVLAGDLLPFGPFVMDRRLRDAEAQAVRSGEDDEAPRVGV